jgi:hypothetical protein
LDGLSDGHSIVEPQESDVIVEIKKTESACYGPQDKPRLWFLGVYATVVLSKCDLDHEPHEPERSMKYEWKVWVE